MEGHKAFIFIHKRLNNVQPFRIDATRFYEAIKLLELVLGPERHWLHEFLVLSEGREVGYSKAS